MAFITGIGKSWIDRDPILKARTDLNDQLFVS